ncbi:MAG: PepSY-associated TM helix domain-containing protein [Verrucomicrobiota bacterium]|nr:PepSY-associated TM helix domain-containing protein [Limisphaera sp.]MDW8381573.1 PepSY-associated TM helix domain-containing protein [Verrucomicrobiota bacterium]
MIAFRQVRRLCRVLHRDLGYLFFGATVIYAVSGIAINHRGDWNPSYSITRLEWPLPGLGTNQPLTRAHAAMLLAEAGITAKYQNHYSPAADQVRIFFEGGKVTLDRTTGKMVIEMVKRRPLLHTFNTLHYNPGRWWTWYADLYSIALLIVAVTGLFLLRGRQGITGRGGLLVGLGILVPGVLAWLYL